MPVPDYVPERLHYARGQHELAVRGRRAQPDHIVQEVRHRAGGWRAVAARIVPAPPHFAGHVGGEPGAPPLEVKVPQLLPAGGKSKIAEPEARRYVRKLQKFKIKSDKHYLT